MKIYPLKLVNNDPNNINIIYPTLIETQKDLILVDTGYPNQLKQIITELKNTINQF